MSLRLKQHNEHYPQSIHVCLTLDFVTNSANTGLLIQIAAKGQEFSYFRSGDKMPGQRTGQYVNIDRHNIDGGVA